MTEDLPEGAKLQKDRYEIVRLLGSSQYSRVYMAKDHKMLKSRIIKEVVFSDNPEERAACKEHFMNEAKQILPLKHPTLPRYFDYFEEDNRFYLVREFVEGKNLDQLISKSTQIIPEKQFKVWTGQLIDIFIYLHSQKPQIFFGSLRPENILVTPMGKIRVMDFGIDRFYPQEQRKNILKKLSADYFPPELIEGEAPTVYSDIYNLGAIVFLMLTNQKPVTPIKFEPKSGNRPDFFKLFEDPVRKCLSLEKTSRYDNATAFKKDMLGEKAAMGGPTIEVEALQLNYVDIPGGRMVQGSFNIKNIGGGLLAGRITADVPWVRVFPEYFNQNEQSVEFNVHTNDLPEGSVHSAVIIITSPTETKKVPIEIALHTEAPKAASDSMPILLMFLLPVINAIALIAYDMSVLKGFEQILGTVSPMDIATHKFPPNLLNSLYFFSAAFLFYAVLCPIYTSILFFMLKIPQQRKFVGPAMLLCLFPSIIAYLCASNPALAPDPALNSNPAFGRFGINGILLQFFALNAFSAIYYSLRIPISSREFTQKNPLIILIMRMLLILLFAVPILLIIIESSNLTHRVIMALFIGVTALLLSRRAKEEE